MIPTLSQVVEIVVEIRPKRQETNFSQMTSDWTACLTGIVLSDTSAAADLSPKHISCQKSLLK